jgi:D-serine deaminase-like pyridoxal phosphate-dependent protein
MAMNAQDLETPALLVDLDAMESNLNRMAVFFKNRRVKLRPHFKNHKVPLLAWKQLEAGAIGITCANLREAEALITHGVRSILIASEIAGESKIQQFADLSRHADLMVATDNESVIRDIGRVARNRKTELSVLVDIEVGLGRCGVEPGEPALKLAKLAKEEGLRFRGLMGYEGHLQALQPSPEKDDLVRIVDKSLVDSRRLIEEHGIGVEIVSTGGTGTYEIGGNYEGITEIQAGSYLLMDNMYVLRGSTYLRTLTVLATVISRPQPMRVVLDCGVKRLSAERGLSTVKSVEGVEVKALHAEHCLLEITQPNVHLEVGQKIELWVHYSDATVSLHDCMFGVRNGRVEDTFKIQR